MHIAYIIMTILILLLIAVPYAVCSLVAWLLRQWPLWSFGFKWAGIALSVAVVLIFVIGFTWGWRHITVNRYRFAHSGVPSSFVGYKIVQMSDFHIGTLSGHPDVVQHIVDSVNALEPDLIVFTGDLVNMAADEESEFHEILRGFRAKDGVVSVMGNHDYMMYAHKHFGHQSEANSIAANHARLADIDRLQAAQRDLGWHLLLNDNYVIRRGVDSTGRGIDSLAIVGVENDGDGRHFPQYGDLTKAQHDLAEGTFKILLSHDPTHWRRRVLRETDIPLQLSGHTHAMQFTLFGWSPSSWMYPEWRGAYTYTSTEEFAAGQKYHKGKCSHSTMIDGVTGASGHQSTHRTLIVSSGIGEVGIPFRFGAWPEIVLITLDRP